MPSQDGGLSLTNVIGVVNDETVWNCNQRVMNERGTTNNTHIINHGWQEVYGGISNSSIIETGGEQLVSIHADINGQANNTTINEQTVSGTRRNFCLLNNQKVAINMFIKVVPAMTRQLRAVLHA